MFCECFSSDEGSTTTVATTTTTTTTATTGWWRQGRHWRWCRRRRLRQRRRKRWQRHDEDKNDVEDDLNDDVDDNNDKAVFMVVVNLLTITGHLKKSTNRHVSTPKLPNTRQFSVSVSFVSVVRKISKWNCCRHVVDVFLLFSDVFFPSS